MQIVLRVSRGLLSGAHRLDLHVQRIGLAGQLYGKPLDVALWERWIRAEARPDDPTVSGLELSEVAERLSISRETVRHHLKGLFSKTGKHSQRDLVHMITMSLPASALVPRHA